MLLSPQSSPLLLLLLVVCLLGLPTPSEEKVEVAGFNVQVFGKKKSEEEGVMRILGKVGDHTMLVG